MKQSFLSNILGKNTYDEYKGYSKLVIAIGTCVLLLLLALSNFVYWGFVSSLLNFVTGTSLLFIAYVAAFIILLDIQVDVEEPERNYWSQNVKSKKPITYNLTIAWEVLLVILGIAAIYFSNNYRKQYAFECETFLVDGTSGIYHLDYNDCEVAEEAMNLKEMKGYEIEDLNCTFCDWCKEWLEDAEADYESSRYYRR